jgi:hypothetical protein
MVQPYISPAKLIGTYSSNEWEEFILEWCHYLKNSGKYVHVQNLGGTGDNGRDVVGHSEGQLFTKPWDNYQCKHYKNKLDPTDVTEEVCKHIYFAFKGEFIPARKYYFVAPQGISTASAKLLGDPEKLKARVLKDWNKVSAKYESIEDLDTPLLEDFIKAFGFEIFMSYSTLDIIVEHSKTSYHARRFGNVPMPKLEIQQAPAKVAAHEAKYLQSILKAYEEKNGGPAPSIDSLELKDQKALKENRDEFYNAEYFQNKSREIHPPEEFSSVQDAIYHGVSHTLKGIYTHGVERLNRTLETVVLVNLGKNNPLSDELGPIHRKGICHQLAGLGRIFWSNKENE